VRLPIVRKLRPELARVIVLGRADVELERAKRRPDAGGDRHLDGRAGRELDAVEIRVAVEPALLRVDIGGDRRLVPGIADAAIGSAEQPLPKKTPI